MIVYFQEIMVSCSFNKNNITNNSIKSNNTNSSLNKDENLNSNEELTKCHIVLGLKQPPPPSGNFEFVCCLNKKREALFKLKPPRPPSGDYELTHCLHKEKEIPVKSY